MKTVNLIIIYYMKQKIQLLVIIPARAKSKKLKNKNIRRLGGHPLIAYSIQAAKAINERNKVIHLSTDSKKILNISKKYYDFTNDLRPKNLSGDYSLDLEFLNHTLKQYKKRNFFFKFCLILRPTNPLRNKETINNFYRKFKNSKFDSLKSIFESPKTPYKMWIKKDNQIKNIFINKKGEFYNYPRQKLPQTYYQTGTIEIVKINYNTILKSFSGKKIMGLKISKEEAIDIDEINDFRKASKMIGSKKFVIPKKLK